MSPCCPEHWASNLDFGALWYHKGVLGTSEFRSNQVEVVIGPHPLVQSEPLCFYMFYINSLSENSFEKVFCC